VVEKIAYTRSVYLNARRPHIKNGIGYKTGDKHNSRVNSNDKEFIERDPALCGHLNEDVGNLCC
jgi:hypothetical protein